MNRSTTTFRATFCASARCVVATLRGRRAFTLVELLSAATVFLMLATFLFYTLAQVNIFWQEAQAQIERRKTARIVLDQITRDLEVAALPSNGVMLYTGPAAEPVASQLSLQLLVNPAQITAAKYLNPSAAFWQAPISTTAQGRMAQVGYFVRWDTANAANPRAILCRYFVNPGDPEYHIESTPASWLSDASLESVAPGVRNSATPAASYKGWFADNIVGIWIRTLDPAGKPIVTNALGTAYTSGAYDSRRGYRYGTGPATVIKNGYAVSGTTYQISATLPPSVEVAVVILDNTAAARLSAKPAYPKTTPATAVSFWTDIEAFVAALPAPARRGARVFSTRIALRNAE